MCNDNGENVYVINTYMTHVVYIQLLNTLNIQAIFYDFRSLQWCRMDAMAPHITEN